MELGSGEVGGLQAPDLGNAQEVDPPEEEESIGRLKFGPLGSRGTVEPVDGEPGAPRWWSKCLEAGNGEPAAVRYGKR